MALTHVHTPIRIGAVEIKNRVVRTAHSTAIGGGTLSDDLIAYHEARAKGGVGLTVLEAMSVHPSSISTLNIIDPSLADRYPKMMERMRPHGMRVFQQLFHAGHHGRQLDGSPPWGASDVPGSESGVPPIPMTKAMIDAVIEGYARTAAAVEGWGGEGAELHAGHGFLPQQFLSTYANVRDDDYGGGFENRARFILEALRAIRAAVSSTFVVGLRLSPDLLEGGVDVGDNLAVATMAEAAGLVDYVSVSSGTFQTMHKMIGGMHEPAGFELVTTAPITRPLTVPTMAIGRFRTLEEADQAIRAGEADLIGMVRATVADPDLVRKSLEGRPEEVRPCIACNQGCIGQLLAPPHRMGCAVNPAVGYELKLGDDRLQPAPTPLKVLVIGGGPAGMEAARVAALRGHKVVLAEAEPNLGGTVKLAGAAPHRGGIRDITFWMQDEIFRLGVEVRTGAYMELDDILAEVPDRVIVATGSTPRLDGVQASNPGEIVQGIDRPNVLSSNDLFLAGSRDPGRSAVVIDDLGHYEAVAAAEHLVAKGVDVAFVTRHIAFAPLVESALMTAPALQRLDQGHFTLHTRTRAISVEPDGVVVGPTYLPMGSNRTVKLPADTVVFVSTNRPNRGLYDELVAAGVDARVVGDANAPRFIPTAIREGHVAGSLV
ncbi:MAG: FAD-dependent oxidoreductase [Phenylobacterium sp.]|uniref:oxidoreductase n=1 Tax=Phenylobacterium sp. TaxID=1871053 RepID=UPI0012292A6C|nr:FAD-dependent oxidoreductase [Phenylobacterium sp.]TAJ74302.1 MAG: FAD-dependent oxidoreductase [Phenylobacterium sp.]